MPMLKIRPLALSLAVLLSGGASAVLATNVAAVPAQVASTLSRTSFDGTVEAVRHTVVAAQVPGAVVELAVKAGDRVQAGQLLLRLDARTADQSAAAVDAQVQAARATLEVATREYQRQQQLYQKKYISQAALEQAEAQFKANKAQVAAQVAQAGAAHSQSGLHTVRAPYAGVVAEVSVVLGDMAMPGKPLLTLYDPSALRVTAALPQSVVQPEMASAVQVELPGVAGAAQWPQPLRVQVLPTVDAATHTVQIRADLPAGLLGVVPGQFARLWLPRAGSTAAASARPGPVSVPLKAVVRRAEMTGVYVQGEGGQPRLRQVRLGRTTGDQVEVLSGLTAGENVMTDPAAASRAPAQ
nr:efflux RND transporter periplasmic adaptor subunit [Giesbergeria anulus]